MQQGGMQQGGMQQGGMQQGGMQQGGMQQGGMDRTVTNFMGFLPRFVAYIVDWIIIFILQVIIIMILGGVLESLMPAGEEGGGFAVTILAVILGAFFYKPLMEGSANQGTVGKMLLGMKVVDEEGNQISMATAFVRTLLWIIGGLIVVGWLMVAVHAKKQGLHDMIAGTYVVPR